jgi:hypothetical protein
MEKNKKGQGTFEMSFSMIFSILLIIFFVIVAFIAIRAFLKTKDCAQIGIFYEDFEVEVRKAWNSQKSNFEFKGNLPGSLEYVCFANLSINPRGEFENIGTDIWIYQGSDANIILSPHQKACIPYNTIAHLDIEKITFNNNPYCVEIIDGRISLKIEKDFNERLVRVS